MIKKVIYYGDYKKSYDKIAVYIDYLDELVDKELEEIESHDLLNLLKEEAKDAKRICVCWFLNTDKAVEISLVNEEEVYDFIFLKKHNISTVSTLYFPIKTMMSISNKIFFTHSIYFDFSRIQNNCELRNSKALFIDSFSRGLDYLEKRMGYRNFIYEADYFFDFGDVWSDNFIYLNRLFVNSIGSLTIEGINVKLEKHILGVKRLSVDVEDIETFKLILLSESLQALTITIPSVDGLTIEPKGFLEELSITTHSKLHDVLSITNSFKCLKTLDYDFK